MSEVDEKRRGAARSFKPRTDRDRLDALLRVTGAPAFVAAARSAG